MSQDLASVSRWFVGSSSRSSSLPANRILASSTRRRSPPDSTLTGRSSRSGARPRPAPMRLAGQDLQQARLADAVTTDEADLVARVHGEGPLVQHEAPSDLQRDTANLQHGGSRVAAGRLYTRARMGGFLRGPTLWFTERATVRRLFTEHRLGRRFAARFVAGDTLEVAIRVAGVLSASGVRTMLN